MALVDLTTCEEVRAVLGVSDDEIEDRTILLPVYEYNLEAELRGVSATLISRCDSVRAKAEADRTDNEKWLLKMASIFATYAVAKNLTTSLPMFSPKEISDSKASIARFAQNPYADTIASILKQFDVAKGRVTAALTAIETVNARRFSYVPNLMRAAGGTDPVTGG